MCVCVRMCVGRRWEGCTGQVGTETVGSSKCCVEPKTRVKVFSVHFLQEILYVYDDSQLILSATKKMSDMKMSYFSTSS